MTTEQTKRNLAAALHRALSTRDWSLMRTIMDPGVTWTLPGDNRISGTKEGVEAVVAHIGFVASYGVSFDLEHVLVSRRNMALAFHNTARRGDVVLDEHLATVCDIEDGRIARIETYLSDVEGMDAFFAEGPDREVRGEAAGG